MANDKKEDHPQASPYKPGNVGPDGDYVVGKNRPPEHSRFAVGDGRKRGRRPKGQKNFDTEFQQEAKRKVTIREGGKERRVSKQRSVIIRAFDNAGSKGQNPAIANIFNLAQKINDKREPLTKEIEAEDEALLQSWIDQKVAERLAGNASGDPETPPVEEADAPAADGPADDYD